MEDDWYSPKQEFDMNLLLRQKLSSFLLFVLLQKTFSRLMKVTNEEVRERTRSERISTQIKNTVEMDWACIENETRFVIKNCANMGTRRDEEEGSSERNLEKNS